MAKFSTTVIAVAIFCLFALTIAGDSTESDESITQISLPRSEAAALRLPSDPVNTETESNTAVVATSVPVTKIRFRPINRRFRVRSIHPCRHHFKFHPKMRANGEIPYGNDMLVSTAGEKSESQEPAGLVDGRRIPMRWVRMHHLHHHHDVDDSDSDDEDDDRLKKLVLRRSEHHLRHHRHHDADDSDSDSDDEGDDRLKKVVLRRSEYKLMKHLRSQKENKKGGLMKRVRKFLDHFF